MRSRLPSCTLTCTRSVSPGSKRGTGRSLCTLSIVRGRILSRMFIASILSSFLVVYLRDLPPGPQIGPPPPRNLFPLKPPPVRHLAVMARDQTLRHAPFGSVGPGPARGPCVVRILQQSVLETLLVRRERLPPPPREHAPPTQHMS